MSGNSAEASANPTYAIGIANDSYEWYKSHAIRSRKAYRVSETAVLVVSATVPAAAAITPHDAVIPAILGALNTPAEKRTDAQKAELANYYRTIDPEQARLRQLVVAQSAAGDPRLTAAQDLAWALINSPAFLFNH